MKNIKPILFLALIITISGCYNAKVNTGLEPSAKVYEDKFASSWIYGLVPPKTVEAVEHCDNGVAIVETKISFVNGLVGNLTLGIYTPMYIKVTCAASSTMLNTDQEGQVTVLERSSNDIKEDIQKPSKKAVQIQTPVYLKLK